MASRFHESMQGRISPQYARLDSHGPPPFTFSNQLNPEAQYSFSQSSALDPGSNTKTVTADAYSREPSPGLGHVATPWRTKWLSKVTLLSMAVLYLGLAGALIGLWLSNKHQEGFDTTLSRNHYSWTYGPTAILVIFLSFWRQVEYYAKLTQPWQVLQSPTPIPASKSVLLDYISPLQITIFWRALKNGHVPVAASVAGFGILKLVILVSTGLLVLTPMPTSLPITVAVTTKFGTDKVLRETFEGAVDDGPVQAYLAAVTNEIPYPAGTLDDRAFQLIEWPEQDISDLRVDLDVFVPKITCEIAEVKTSKVLDPGRLYVELTTPSCSVSDLDLSGSSQNGRNRVGTAEPQFYTYYDFWRVNCSGETTAASVTSIDNTTTADLRHAMMVSNISSYSNISENGGSTTDQVAFDLAAIICDVDYGVEQLNLLHNQVDGRLNVSSTGEGTGLHLDAVSGVMLGEQIFSSLTKAISISFPDEDDDEHNSYYASSPLFWTMLRSIDEALEALLDPELLQSSAERTWNGLAAQVFRQAYEEPAEDTVEGVAIYEEEKLRIGIVSLWVMVAGFSVLAVLSILVAFTVRQEVVAHDPRLIVPLDCEPLRGAGALRTSQLEDRLQGWSFHTTFQKGFKLIAVGEGAPEVKAKNKPWAPFSTKYWMIGLMLISPLVVIVVLEILQRMSDANQGIADVTGSEETAGYLSHYLSAGFILLLATSINNFDFTITSFAPYSILRSGAAPASRSINFTLLGELAPVALAKSLKRGHFSSTFSNIAGVIGSVLTIVVSGLWTIDHSVERSSDVSFSATSSWDVSWPNSSLSDGGAARAFDQIQHGAASEPANIWEDLVFPTFDSLGNTSLTIQALRPDLSCTIATDDEIEIEFFTDSDEHEWLRLRALPALPPDCQRGGQEGTNSYANFSTLIEYYDLYAGHWTGLFVDVHMGPWPTPTNDTGRLGEAGEDDPPNPLQPDNPPNCPSLGLIFAQNNGENTTASDITALLCSQTLSTVTVQATYSDGKLVKPSATSPEILSSAPLPDTLPYRVQPHFRALTAFSGNNTDEQTAPNLINHILYAPDAPDVQTLFGRANRDAFVNETRALYARYMAHVADLHFRREALPDSDSATEGVIATPEISGTQTTVSARLTMNRGSKIALQVMLGVVCVLSGAAFAACDVRGTLPRGPYSVASGVALVAGGEFGGRQREGEKGELYSLGWWAGGREMREMEWRNEGGDGRRHGDDGVLVGERRFGIDVGMPEELGFRRTGWWEMRRRMTGGLGRQ